MAAATIISTMSSSTGWTNLTSLNGKRAFIIAVKGSDLNTDTVTLKDITKIVLSVGIDSGITNQPVTIRNITLDFTQETSDDESTNKLTALAQIDELPADLYVKVLSIQTRMQEYRTFEENIAVNVVLYE